MNTSGVTRLKKVIIDGEERAAWVTEIPQFEMTYLPMTAPVRPKGSK